MIDLSIVPELPSSPVRALHRLTTVAAGAPVLALILLMPCLPLPAASGWAAPIEGVPEIRRMGRPPLEVAERLRRLRSVPSMPEEAALDCVRETWLEFREHADEWHAPLLRRALRPADPLRAEAIFALRFFGTEQNWEHLEHLTKGGACLRGNERGVDRTEATLRSIARAESGTPRTLALESLSGFSTWSSAEFLVQQIGDDGDCETIDGALQWIRQDGWVLMKRPPIAFGGVVPGRSCPRAATAEYWRAWWLGVLRGREGFPGDGRDQEGSFRR